jgi:CubicO group peptidase (beta-lactamase class C family)
VPVSSVWVRTLYSNTAFQLVGYALEQLTGQSYKELMEQLIFKSLGMNNISVFALTADKGLVMPGYNDWWNWSFRDEAPW